MARIRVRQQGFLYMLSANESDGGNVGRGGDTDKGGAVAGSADILITDTGNEVCFSGPIHITEPGDKNELPGTWGAAEASDAEETTKEVHNTNQEQSKSLSRFPESLPPTSQKRHKRRATTRVPGSETQQETKLNKRARAPNWTREETQMLIACKSQPSLPKGHQGWEAIALEIPTRDAVQCRQRWDTLQKRDNTTLTATTYSGPAANELIGASTSTHPEGKTDLLSSACPNLEVSLRAALPVEPRIAAVESEAAVLQPIPELPAVAQDGLPTTTECPHPAVAADHVYDCEDPIDFWRRNLLSPDDTY